MWLEFLLDRIYNDGELLEELYKIDNKICATNLDSNNLINYIKQNKNIKKFFSFENYDIAFLLEGSSTALLSIINDYYDSNIKIYINDENVSINTWIKKVYEDFCNIYNITNRLDIKISNHFKIESDNIILIGSEAFILEMKKCLKDKNIIDYEYEG